MKLCCWNNINAGLGEWILLFPIFPSCMPSVSNNGMSFDFSPFSCLSKLNWVILVFKTKNELLSNLNTDNLNKTWFQWLLLMDCTKFIVHHPHPQQIKMENGSRTVTWAKLAWGLNFNFLSAIWLPNSPLWANINGTASLSQS